MPMISRLNYKLVLPLLAVWLLSCAPLWGLTKNEIIIYDYEGIAEGITEAKFGMFRGILTNKIERMKRELPAAIKGFKQVETLEPSFQNRTTGMGSAGIQLWLDNRATALCLLTGTIASEDDKNFLVISNVYLGELREYLPFDPIIIPMPIKVSEFSNIQDSHSLVIFYALAMDAKRNGVHSSIVSRLLAMAKEKLANIDSRSDQLGADLSVLRTAIEKAEQDLVGVTDGS